MKDRLRKVGRPVSTVDGHRAVLGYRRADMRWQTTVSAPGAVVTAGSPTFRVRVEPGSRWSASVRVEVSSPVAGRAAPRPVPLDRWEAGLPWFMALFGRDSLITGYQVLPFAPGLCRATRRALAALRATAVDDVRDAQPGKIAHELRHGELTLFGERPHSPLLLLRCMLGLEPDGDRRSVDPWGPFGPVGLYGIPGRWGRADAVEIG